MFDFLNGKGKGGRGPGGPLSPFQHSELVDQSIAEMLTVIRRVLADGVVTEEEAAALSAWTMAHPAVVEAWPGKVLSRRLERIFMDGRVDDEEREDLGRLLRALASGNWGVRLAGDVSAGLPLTDPPPILIFPEQCFVFAGDFAFGPLPACERAVAELGGRTARAVSPDTDIVVVGTFGVAEWNQSPEAGEIRVAQELRRAGQAISIVSESYWASSLPTL